MTNEQLHETALVVATELRRKEAQLLPLLMEMRKRRLFYALGYTGIYDYATRYLKLSEAQAAYYRRVAEKAEEVPQLKAAVSDGSLSLSKARRIVKVVSEENAEEWIDKAQKLPQRELEKAVSEVNPDAVIRERIRPVAKEKLELRTGISPGLEAKLKRVQDLLGTSSIEKALEASLDAYLEKHDPIKKAERAEKRKQKPVKPSSGRKKLPAAVVHAVNRRDEDQCTHLYPDGSRCESRRFLQKHHVQEVARGGLNTADNLVTPASRITAASMRARSRYNGHGPGR
jgi:hypothetical protein